MILTDQPTIFDDDIVAAVSSIDDGNMKFCRGDDQETKFNRVTFLQSVEIEPSQTTLLQTTYDSTDFCRYRVLDDDQQGEGMLESASETEADAVVVTRPDHAVFLPLADCAGAVIYDPTNQVMMVSHLGRHSVEQEGARKSLQFMIDEFETNPADVKIWLSPAVGGDSYPLQAFEGRGLQQVIVAQFAQLGVPFHHIEVCGVDTAESDDYFSHSQYKAGERDFDGRFAIVAMMRD
jgi:copper oxidase (laccase) domain-containing protein